MENMKQQSLKKEADKSSDKDKKNKNQKENTSAKSKDTQGHKNDKKEVKTQGKPKKD